ncbi:hypothetical protein K1T71_013753 [Dendrolimus kikuchii]|uniref:Uncharacterized protein n=1 Tax=Dendrolimus kikuchii TaxID=765133 RepID=A0ACC1CHD8_9NEOP|nr:hypothetical protein K1T71_013753 [Dendrolimus kikuchii]
MYIAFLILNLVVNIFSFEVPSYRSKPLTRSSEADPRWIPALQSRIKWLVSTLGYNAAKSFISDLVNDTEIALGVSLHVEVSRDGESSVYYNFIKESRKFNDQGYDAAAEPTWLEDLKTLVREMISKYGKKHLDLMLKPVIKSVEKKNGVTITDIDGEVIVDYLKNKKRYKSGKRL